MERQEKSVQKIQQLLSDAESMWKDLPRLADLQRSANHTLEALRDVEYNLTGNQERGMSYLATVRIVVTVARRGEHKLYLPTFI